VKKLKGRELKEGKKTVRGEKGGKLRKLGNDTAQQGDKFPSHPIPPVRQGVKRREFCHCPKTEIPAEFMTKYFCPLSFLWNFFYDWNFFVTLLPFFQL
jgi:hypothetical protein